MKNTIQLFTFLSITSLIFSCNLSKKDNGKDLVEKKNQVNPLVNRVKVKKAQVSDLEVVDFVNLCEVGQDTCVKVIGNGASRYSVCFDLHNDTANDTLIVLGINVRIPGMGTAVPDTCRLLQVFDDTLSAGSKHNYALTYCMAQNYQFRPGEPIAFDIDLKQENSDTTIMMNVCHSID